MVARPADALRLASPARGALTVCPLAHTLPTRSPALPKSKKILLAFPRSGPAVAASGTSFQGLGMACAILVSDRCHLPGEAAGTTLTQAVSARQLSLPCSICLCGDVTHTG